MGGLESYLEPFPGRRVCRFRTVLKPAVDQNRRVNLGLSIVTSKEEEMPSLREIGHQLREKKPKTIGVAEGKNRVTVSFNSLLDAIRIFRAMQKKGHFHEGLEVQFPF